MDKGIVRKQSARVVLSGGAAFGLAEIGVLEVLESRFEITGIVGTSIGAIVGGLYAAGSTPAEMLKLAQSFRKKDLFNPFHLDKRLSGIFDGKAILRTFVKWTCNAQVEACRIPFLAVTYDLNKRKTVIIDRGPLARALRASSSIPYLFAPYRWGNYNFVDGGIEYPLPLGLHAALPGEITIAVNVLPQSAGSPETIALARADASSSTLRLPEVFLSSIFQNQAFLAMHSILDNRPDLVISAWYPKGEVFGFDEAEKLYRFGLDQARKALEEQARPGYLARVRKYYRGLTARLSRGL